MSLQKCSAVSGPDLPTVSTDDFQNYKNLCKDGLCTQMSDNWLQRRICNQKHRLQSYLEQFEHSESR